MPQTTTVVHCCRNAAFQLQRLSGSNAAGANTTARSAYLRDRGFWDEELRPAMENQEIAIPEEAVAGTFLGDRSQGKSLSIINEHPRLLVNKD
jgi:hypothetical protein